MIPVLYSFDASWRNENYDLFELFLASLCGLCGNSSQPLDLVLVCRNFTNLQVHAVELAVSAGLPHKVRIVREGDPLMDAFDETEAPVDIKDLVYWPKCIFDRLAVKDVFQGYDRAFIMDSDMLFRTDIARYYDELPDDVILKSYPDIWQIIWKHQGKPENIHKEPQVNFGIVLCNLKAFPSLKEIVAFYKSSAYLDRIDKTRGFHPAEQEAISFYAYDHGLRMAAFDPSEVVMYYYYSQKEFYHEKDFVEMYRSFGIENASLAKIEDARIVHAHEAMREKMYYDPETPEYAVYAPFRRTARRILDGLELQCPFVAKEWARATDVTYPSEANRPFHSPRRYRNVVVSNQGADRWNDFLMPSVLSLSVHTKDQVRLIVLEGEDHSSDFEKDSLVSVLKYGNRENVADFRVVNPDTEIVGSSRWTPVHLHKVFASDLLSDVDDYCLFMDSDILVVDDLSPLFAVCDVQPTVDKVVGTLNWYHFVRRSEIPVQLSGGFFFMHPKGRAVRAMRLMEFAEYWNANDEYVLGQCVSPKEFVNIGNACVEATTEGFAHGRERMQKLAESGIGRGRTFAVHLLNSTNGKRFVKDRMRDDYKKYVDEWFFCRDMSKRIAFGGAR